MELLTIKHRDFTLQVDCDKFDKVFEKANGNMEICSSVYDWSDGVESVTLNGKEIKNIGENKDIKQGKISPPCFFDNTDYPLWVEFTEEVSAASFDSDNRKVADNFRFHAGRQVLAGFLNFGNEIGHSAIEFSYTLASGERRNFFFSFTVLSTKLDYYEHWKAIIRDIEQEYRTLSIDFLKKTFHSFDISDTSGDTPDLIWWQVFRGKHDEFTEAVRAILDRPRHRLRNQEIYQRADRIRRFTPQLENQLAEHRNEAGHLYRTETPAINNDTYENRFLKHAVQHIAEKHAALGKIIVNDYQISENLRSEIQEKMEGMEQIAHHPFFRTVGGFRGVTHESLVLQQATNYSTVYSTWLLLQQSYSLLDGMHNLETKDIATLYEIWCFIQMKEIVRKQMGDSIEVDNACRMELNEQFVRRLDRGDLSRILFRKGDVELAELVYNPTQGKEDNRTINIEQLVSLTVPQKPDMVLRLTKWDEDKRMKLTYLFDAKYRIDGHENGADVPPEDAINQMHRYRDAIYYRENPQQSGELKKEVVGGYILFPGDGSKKSVEMADFYRSIKQVNIGAFPLRPADTENRELLEEFVKGLIEPKGAQTLLTSSNVIPQKGLRYDWDDGTTPPRESTIVQYVSKEDLEKYRQHRAYWVRLGTGHGSLRIDPRMASIRWIVFKLMGKSTVAYRYAVSSLGAEVLNKDNMIKRGYKDAKDKFHDPYLVYRLKGVEESIDWEKFQESTPLVGLATDHTQGKHPYIYPPIPAATAADGSDLSDGSDHL